MKDILARLFGVLSTFGRIKACSNCNVFIITNPTKVDMSAVNEIVADIEGWICTHRKLEECRPYTDDSGRTEMEKPQVWVGASKKIVQSETDFVDRASDMM